MDIRVQTIVCGAYQENAYLVYLEGRNDALVIDPGDDVPALIKAAEGRTVTHILLTHGHFDHILGAPALARATGAKVYVHPADAPMLLDAKAALIDESAARTPFEPLADVNPYPDTLSACGMEFFVIHTPGHTPGGVCLYEKECKVLFTGDTLFLDGYGRTDFPGGSFQQLRQSLRALLALPGDTQFYPGHGEGGRIGRYQ